MFTLLKKEIHSFLSSLIGYIAITVFLLVISLFLWVLQTDSNILDSGYANIDPLFIIAPWVFLFLIPAITMRSFADEKKAGTIELLLTRPLTDLQIILAKYFAGFLLVLFSLIPTLIYYYSVHAMGSPAGNIDTGGMWGSYIGLLFLGAAFVAIGIFASAVTDNQVVSFILAVFLCYFIYTGFDFMASFALFGNVDNIILALGINHHYISMSRGVIDTRDIIYFVSLIAFFILATRTVLESRKWEPHPASPKGRSKIALIFASPLGRSGGASALSLILAVTILVLLNFVGTYVFHRFDLTSEKRYTLSDATKKLLGELNDVVYVKVYLEGEFPSGFKRLRDETREMLDEFRVYSNDNIEYEFINPNENPDKKQREEVYRQLFKKGLQPTNLEVKEESGISQQIIFPGAIVSHKGREMAWQLLKTNMGQSPEAQLNNSVQALEYEFASCILNLSTALKPQIGIIEGHGELDTLALQDIRDALREFYYVRQVKINEQLKALDGLKAIIIAKPDTAFSEKDKFIIDQYVMRGGKVLWAIDPLNTSIDSLRKLSRTIAIPQELKLDDQLFKYGVRLNQNILLDLQSSAIPVNKAFVGQPPRFELMPWIFSPLLLPKSNHPIVNNLDVIKVEYASTLDTIDVKGIKKTILLQSSKYSITQNAPVRVDLRMVNMTPDENQFKDSYKPIALLLEGEFESVFKNRVPPQIVSDSAIAFKDKGVNTKMIVISDGDIIRNEVQYSTGKSFPLGYDIYTKQTYGNKNFILNCMNYLCDDSGLITVRAKELTLRLLDKKKMKNERVQWQVINTALPLLLILVFGIVYSIIRKRKYAR